MNMYTSLVGWWYGSAVRPTMAVTCEELRQARARLKPTTIVLECTDDEAHLAEVLQAHKRWRDRVDAQGMAVPPPRTQFHELPMFLELRCVAHARALHRRYRTVMAELMSRDT